MQEQFELIKAQYTKFPITIGIDPDCEKSGIAFVMGNNVIASRMVFAGLIDKVRSMFFKERRMAVFVEAGWLNKTHWHIPKGASPQYCAAIGNKVGRNAETGRKIIEMLTHYGIPCFAVAPLRKHWMGKDHKITQGEINNVLEQRGLNELKRCNQDVRDAVMIAVMNQKWREQPKC